MENGIRRAGIRRDKMSEIIYTLNCDKCGKSYQSTAGFPAVQLCPECIAPEDRVKALAKKIQDWDMRDGFIPQQWLDEYERLWEETLRELKQQGTIKGSKV